MQATYNGLELPKNGQPIEYKNGQFEVPDHPIHPIYRRRRHGARHLEGLSTGLRRRSREGLRRQAHHPLVRDLCRRKGFSALRQLAARRLGSRRARPESLHQGTADHAGRRRHPLAQRGPAPDARPLRLRAPGEVLPGRPQPCEAPREAGHRHLPREHRRRIRGHRVQGRQRRRRPAA